MKVRVLSLWQPWATLWMGNLKEGETRHFRNTFTGLVIIHATMYVDHTICKDPVFAGALKHLGFESSKQLPRGAALGTCQLQEAKPVEDVLPNLSTQEFAFGNFESGRFWWPATHKEAFAQPIPLKGQQSVPWTWEVPVDLEAMFDAIPDVAMPLFQLPGVVEDDRCQKAS